MAKRKHYTLGALILVCCALCPLPCWSGEGGIKPVQDSAAGERRKTSKYIFSLRSADLSLERKISSRSVRRTYRFQELREEKVSLSRLKREVGKRVIYKGRDIALDKGLWYLEYPLETAVTTLESLDDFRRYLSEKIGADTDIEVSDDGVGFSLKKKF